MLKDDLHLYEVLGREAAKLTPPAQSVSKSAPEFYQLRFRVFNFAESTKASRKKTQSTQTEKKGNRNGETQLHYSERVGYSMIRHRIKGKMNVFIISHS